MAGPKFWLLLLVSISVPAAFGKFDYHKYIDKYHKGSSTTETPLKPGITSTTAEATTSTSDTSSLQDIFPSTEDSSENSEENEYEYELPADGIQGEGHIANGTILQGDPYYDVNIQYVFIMRIVIIVGSVIVFVVVLGCIVCCCPKCCRGNERRGFIIRDNREAAHPQQPLVSQQPQQQPVLVQHFPPNYTQEQTQQFPAPYPQQLPPQYPHQQQYSPQYAPGQPDHQISPNALQFYNPPEAPPPYEDKPSHKY